MAVRNRIWCSDGKVLLRYADGRFTEAEKKLASRASPKRERRISHHEIVVTYDGEGFLIIGVRLTEPPPFPITPTTDIVCPWRITPTQNIDIRPFWSPSALFSTSRYKTTASRSQDGADERRSGRRTGETNFTFGGNTDCCIENEYGYGGAEAHRFCCLVHRDRGLHRSFRLVRHRCGWQRGCERRVGSAIRRAHACCGRFGCRGGVVVAISCERALAASRQPSAKVRSRGGQHAPASHTGRRGHYRRAAINVLGTVGPARRREHHRRCFDAGCNAIPVCSTRHRDADCAGIKHDRRRGRRE